MIVKVKMMFLKVYKIVIEIFNQKVTKILNNAITE